MRFERGSGVAGTTGAGAERDTHGGGTRPTSGAGGGGGGGGGPPPKQNHTKLFVTDLLTSYNHF